MKKTPVWQIVLLVALLGMLVFAMVKAFSGALAPKRTAPQPQQQAAAADATRATDMPDVVPTTSRGRLGEDVDLTARGQLNSNLFKVYQLQPPKNPFIQEEEWYAENLEQVPGYPELTESEFFETMDVYLPDLGFIYDDPNDWRNISIKRSQENKYSIVGSSEDGLIQTQIDLEKDVPTDNIYGWQKGSKVPITALRNSEWVMEQIRLGNFQAEVEEEVAESLFDEQGLPIPGTERALEGIGDTFATYGVSVKGERSSALLMYNGAPRIVTKGMVLPTHYEVLEINQDGVVLVDVRNGFSIPVPLGADPVSAPASDAP